MPELCVNVFLVLPQLLIAFPGLHLVPAASYLFADAPAVPPLGAPA